MSVKIEAITKTWATKEDFDASYNIGLEPHGHPNTRPERRGGYQRATMFNANVPYLDSVTPEWSRILDVLARPQNTSMCIIAAGYGWSIEYLNAQGYADVWGVDTSLHIQSTKEQIDPEDGIKCSLVGDHVHDADLKISSERTRFLQDSGHTGSLFNVVVTERLLSCITDVDAVSMSAEVRKTLLRPDGELIHIESPGPGDPTMNWHTLQEWKDLLPLDTIVSSGGREFL